MYIYNVFILHISCTYQQIYIYTVIPKRKTSNYYYFSTHFYFDSYLDCHKGEPSGFGIGINSPASFVVVKNHDIEAQTSTWRIIACHNMIESQTLDWFGCYYSTDLGICLPSFTVSWTAIRLELLHQGRWACENFDAREEKRERPRVSTGCVDTQQPKPLYMATIYIYTY